LKKFDREKVLKLLIGEKTPVIFDIGANNGASLVEFRMWWPDANVYCFEPQQECRAELEERAARYSSGSVIINKVGAGATASEGLTFYTHDLTTGQSGFNRINTESHDSIRLNELSGSQKVLEQYEASLNHARTVPLVRLDGYITDNSIGKVNFLKIDTQGYEPEVLSGLDWMSDCPRSMWCSLD
jgi:FkbM family methyltransferase